MNIPWKTWFPSKPSRSSSRSETPESEQPLVGNLLNTATGLRGQEGTWCDYVIAGNGLFIREAKHPLVQGCIRIAAAQLKGASPRKAELNLVHGKIPARLILEGIRWMSEAPANERFFSISLTEKGQYSLTIPDQNGTSSSLAYQPPEKAVAEFHSHGHHGAYFSATDDQDEQGCRIYGVIAGLPEKQPRAALRLGIYGYFAKLSWNQIAQGETLNQLPPMEATH